MTMPGDEPEPGEQFHRRPYRRQGQTLANDTLIEDITTTGWAVIDADNLSGLALFRDRFEHIVRSNVPNANPDDSVSDLLMAVTPAELNLLLKTVNYGMLESTRTVLDSFGSAIAKLCKNEIFYQKRIYLRVNVPGEGQDATPAHTDVYYGHSPCAYTLWVPMYDVADESGIYLFDRRSSARIVSSYRFDEPISHVLQRESAMPGGVTLTFGQAILFECSIVHGAHENTGGSPRVSFDMRVQSTTQPLFQKGYDLYATGNLI